MIFSFDWFNCFWFAEQRQTEPPTRARPESESKCKCDSARNAEKERERERERERESIMKRGMTICQRERREREVAGTARTNTRGDGYRIFPVYKWLLLCAGLIWPVLFRVSERFFLYRIAFVKFLASISPSTFVSTGVTSRVPHATDHLRKPTKHCCTLCEQERERYQSAGQPAKWTYL